MSSSNNPFNPFRRGNSSSSGGGGNDKAGKSVTLKPIFSANANNPFRSEYDKEASNNPWASHSKNTMKNESQSFAAFDQAQAKGLLGPVPKDPWASSTWKPSSSQESNNTPDPFSGITGYEMINKGRPIEQQYKPTYKPQNKRDSAQDSSILQPEKKY